MKSNIYSKLATAKMNIGKVVKNSKNPHFKNTYADINALLDTVEPELMEVGLLLLQPIEDGKVVSKIIDVETGESISSALELPLITDPQKVISATTYYRRATIQSLLSLQAVDDDGNTASGYTKSKQPISDEKFKRALKAIKDGSYTIQQLRESFQLTKDQEGKL
jgi:hypothetical protein